MNNLTKLLEGLKLVLLGSKKTARNTGFDWIFYTIWSLIVSTTIRSLFKGFPLGFLSLIGIYFESLAISDVAYSREKSLFKRLVFSLIIWSIGAYIISFGGIGKYQFFGIWVNIHILASLLGLTYYFPRNNRLNIYRFCLNPFRFIKEYRNNKPKSLAAFFKSSTIEDHEGALVDINRAIDKGESGDFHGAISDFNKVIEINPRNPNAYYNRGRAKNALEDYAGAISDYSKAIEINPRYVDAYYLRGNAKKVSGDYSGAIADFNKAIEINPRYEKAFYNIGITKWTQGDKQGACDEWKKAAELGDEDAAKLLKEHCNG